MSRRSRRVLSILAILTYVAVGLVAAKESATQPDVFGYFRIAGTPPAFADISEVQLAGSGEYGAAAKPPYHGLIRMKAKKASDYKLKKPVISGNKISFTTEWVGGVSYAFDGMLKRTDFTADDIPRDKIILRGTLKKLQGGKPMAEAELGFLYDPGD